MIIEGDSDWRRGSDLLLVRICMSGAGAEGRWYYCITSLDAGSPDAYEITEVTRLPVGDMQDLEVPVAAVQVWRTCSCCIGRGGICGYLQVPQAVAVVHVVTYL